MTVDGVTFDPCSDPFRAAPPGETIAMVDVTIENRSSPGAPSYGSWDWVLVDDTGQEFFDTVVPCHPRGDSPFLETGVSVSRRLEFVIPGDATGLVLRWDGLGPEHAVEVDIGQ